MSRLFLVSPISWRFCTASLTASSSGLSNTWDKKSTALKHTHTNTHAHKHTSLKQTEVFKKAENTGIISALPCNWDCGFWLVQLDFPTGCEGSLEWGKES